MLTKEDEYLRITKRSAAFGNENVVYVTTKVVQPIGWKKKVNPETAAHAGHIFVVLR